MQHRAIRDAAHTTPCSGDFGTEWSLTPDQLVSKHMDLVRSIARLLHRSLPQHIEVDDLISAGTIGLIEALQRFVADGEASFETFASARIRGAMLDALRQTDWAPKELRRRGRAIEKATRECTTTLGRLPEQEEVARSAGIPLAELHQTLADLDGLKLGSIQNSFSEDEEQVPSFLRDPAEPGALVHCLRAEFRGLLAESIDALPFQERLVVTLYYYEELQIAGVASVMQLSRTRVVQLKASALARIRVSLGEHAKGRVDQ